MFDYGKKGEFLALNHFYSWFISLCAQTSVFDLEIGKWIWFAKTNQVVAKNDPNMSNLVKNYFCSLLHWCCTSICCFLMCLHKSPKRGEIEREMCPWAISSIFWWLSVHRILSGLLYVKWWMKCKSTRMYASRLSTFVLGTNEVTWVLEIGKEKYWKRVPVCSQDSAQSSTPDSVWCTRLVSGELATLGKTSAVYGYNSPDCPVVHQTVQWANGRQCNGRPPNPRATCGPLQRSAGGTGQCPVRQLPQNCNGRKRQKRKEIAHRTATGTVRWRTGLFGAPPDRRQDLPSKNASNGS
jgi:hypothetical protein